MKRSPDVMLGFLFVCCPVMAQQAPLSAEQVARMLAEVPSSRWSEVELSPDGKWVTYGLERRSLAEDEPRKEILLQPVPWNGARAAKPVSMPANARALQWHPDSRSLSMVIGADGVKNPDLVRYDVATGQLTTLFAGKSNTSATIGADYRWSPTGKYIAFTSPLERELGLDKRRGVPVTAWRVDERSSRSLDRLFVLEVATGRVLQLTPDNLHVFAPFDWAPDEQALVFAAATESRGENKFLADLMIVDCTTGKLRDLVKQPGMDASPRWSPDGRWIAFATQAGEPSYNYGGGFPALVEARGGEVVYWKKDGTPTVSYTGAFWWEPDSRSFFYESRYQMHVAVVRADVAARTASVIPAPSGLSLPFDDNPRFSADRRSMAYVRSSITVPPELFVTSLGRDGKPAGKPVQVTNLSEGFALSPLVHVEEISWPSPDAKFTIHGLLLTPESARQNGRIGKPLPAVLAIRGGPSMVTRGFASDGFHGADLAVAARGYAVLIPNTRGRGGYGEAFERGIADGKSNAGLPYKDAIAGVDLIVKQGIADPAQLGVMGHSYGGFLTEYTITQTNRFKGAVVHEGHVVEMLNFRYILFEQNHWRELLARDLYGVHDPFNAAERARLVAESPGLNADRIKTPTLLLFGANAGADDVGLPFFNGLQRFNVPSAFFVYDEGHVFRRPAAIADDITRTGEWLDFWVRGMPYTDEKRAQEYEAWRKDANPGKNLKVGQ